MAIIHPLLRATQKVPETSFQSGHGDDQAADWQQTQSRGPAVSKARTNRLLHSSLDYLHDLEKTAKARCENLLDFLQDSILGWHLEQCCP